MRKNEIYNIEKITSIEETYYMQSNIIDGLQRDFWELSQNLMVVGDDNNHLKAIKEIEDRSYEKKNTQIAESKSKIKDLEREARQL